MMGTQGAREMRGQDAPTGGMPAAEGTGLEEIIASSGISPRFWRLYAYFWLVCLFFPIYYLARTPLRTVPLLAAVGGLAIFTAAYAWAMWPYPLSRNGNTRSGPGSPAMLPAGLTLLVLFLSLAYGSAFTWLFLGASAITGVKLPARRAFWGVMVLTLLSLGAGIAASGGIAGTDWLQLIPLVLLVRGLGLDMTGLTRLGEALWELNAARQELARKAVVEERLRVARDLHDLLGQTLTLITLKSELAGRLIEKDPGQAAKEVAEIEGASRQALREVRQAIAGYRGQTLASELDGARQILEAAGIACRIENATRGLPPGLEAALAWMVREGATNVIRHSRARQCLIRIANQGGTIHAEVINDGGPGLEGAAHEAGSGLTGLAGRIAVQGGKLEAGPFSIQDRPGFRLAVELPIQGGPARKERQQR
jgi:two-component system sensor histidine kinase DesK